MSVREAFSAIRARWTATRGHFLFLPAMLAGGLAGLALVLTWLEKSNGPDGFGIGFDGDPPAARILLSTVAGSLITVAGLTYSLTIVSLQLVSQQLTPRALRNFLEDRLNQAVAGVFIGLFAYCLLVLRTVRGAPGPDGSGSGFVPSTSITIAIVLGVAAIGLLLVFIHHVTQTIQASEIASSIAHATLSSLGDIYPEPFGKGEEEPGDEIVASWYVDGRPELVHPERPGYVQAVSLDELPQALDAPRLRARVRVCPGDFATPSEPVAEIWNGKAEEGCVELVRKHIVIGGERTLREDVAFGVRQLADIAIRALSPSLNDPTTAITCVRYLGVIVARLAGRRFPAAVRRINGAIVVARHRTLDEFVDIAFVQLGRHAAREVHVAEALLEAAAEAARAASAAGAPDRAELFARVADDVAAAAAEEAAASDSDRGRLRAAADRVRDAASGRANAPSHISAQRSLTEP